MIPEVVRVITEETARNDSSRATACPLSPVCGSEIEERGEAVARCTGALVARHS